MQIYWSRNCEKNSKKIVCVITKDHTNVTAVHPKDTTVTDFPKNDAQICIPSNEKEIQAIGSKSNQQNWIKMQPNKFSTGWPGFVQ